MPTGQPLTLPPGVSAKKFALYLDEARHIVGRDNVVVTEGEHQFVKDEYLDPAKEHDMFYVLDKDYFVSSAVVSPRNVKEVQALMRLSNKYKVAVWPFSAGRNIGYGGTAPRVPGSVAIDMGTHMNRVLEVNEKDAYCLVEPGVTFQSLYDHLVKVGLDDKLWIDVPDLGGGSVIGNTIERGVGYTPYGDHFMVSSGVRTRRDTDGRCTAVWRLSCRPASWSAPAWVRFRSLDRTRTPRPTSRRPTGAGR